MHDHAIAQYAAVVNRHTGVQPAITADMGVFAEHGTGADRRSAADDGAVSDHCVRTDFNLGIHLRTRIDRGRWVDTGHHGARRLEQRRYAGEIQIGIFVHDARYFSCFPRRRRHDHGRGVRRGSLAQVAFVCEKRDGAGARTLQRRNTAYARFRVPDDLSAETLGDLTQAVAGRAAVHERESGAPRAAPIFRTRAL
jgi:hypothetical protein